MKATEDGEKKKTPKPVKKVVPAWASISDEARKNLSKGKLPKPKVQDAILAAMAACADSKGLVSSGAIRKFVMEENPDLPKMVLKKARARLLQGQGMAPWKIYSQVCSLGHATPRK